MSTVSLKDWYTTKMDRLVAKKQAKDLTLTGPLAAFYATMKMQLGGESARVTRDDMDKQFKAFVQGAQTDPKPTSGEGGPIPPTVDVPS